MIEHYFTHFKKKDTKFFVLFVLFRNQSKLKIFVYRLQIKQTLSNKNKIFFSLKAFVMLLASLFFIAKRNQLQIKTSDNSMKEALIWLSSLLTSSPSNSISVLRQASRNQLLAVYSHPVTLYTRFDDDKGFDAVVFLKIWSFCRVSRKQLFIYFLIIYIILWQIFYHSSPFLKNKFQFKRK